MIGGRGTTPPSRPGPRGAAPCCAAGSRGLVAAAVVAGLVWLLGFSSVFDVTDVEVDGASAETLPAVRTAAQVAPGASLLWLDTADLDARVQTIPRVATVDVRRSLPHTVTVTVTEREPVAAMPLGAGVALVDGTGFAYRTMPAPPPGIPRLVLGPGLAAPVGPHDGGRRPRARGPAARPAREDHRTARGRARTTCRSPSTPAAPCGGGQTPTTRARRPCSARC